MNENVRKGPRSQLIGINLWVVSLFLAFLAMSVFNHSPVGFLLIFVVILLVVIGLVRVLAGSYLLHRGIPRKRGRWLVSLSVVLVLASPFIIVMGLFSFRPLNYILLQMGIWSFLVSFTLPYLRKGGFATGIIAFFSATLLSVVILAFILFGGVSLPIMIPAVLGGSYFLFLEITIFRFYLKALDTGGEMYMPDLDVKPDALAVRTSSVPGPVRLRMRPEPPPARRADPLADLEQQVERESAGRPRDLTSFEDFVREMGRGQGPSYVKKAASPPPPPVDEREPAEGPRSENRADLDLESVLLDGEDLYSVLRVGRNADIGELRRGYRKRALLYHPDMNRDGGEVYRESINEEMRKLNKAKEILFDPEKREEYDLRLEEFEGRS